MAVKRTIDADALLEELGRGWPRPTDGQEWAVGQTFSQYLFYEYVPERKARWCSCTSCGEAFWVDKPGKRIWTDGRTRDFWKLHHKMDGLCPHCLNEVRYIAIGRMRSCATLAESRHVLVLRYVEGRGLFALAAVARKEYGRCWVDQDWNPPVIMDERRLYLFREKGAACLRWENDWTGLGMAPSGKMLRNDWVPMASVGEPFPCGSFSNDYDGGYYVFGVEELARSPLRYHGYDAFLTDCAALEDGTYHHGLLTYLAEYTRKPQLEMLSKLGLRDIVRDLLAGRCNHSRVNWKGRSPAGLLRLSKAEARDYLRLGGCLDDLDAWREERKVRPGLGLAEYLETVRILGNAAARKKAADLADGLGLRLPKVLRYLNGQKGRDRDASGAFRMWDDYLSAARRLGLDMAEETVMLPKDLRERHDAAVRQVTVLADVEAVKRYRRRRKGLRQKFEFEAGGLMIRVPQTGKEIIEEGKSLRHCVGGYADRHLQGKVVILFLRRAVEPDTPYVTIEMEGHNWDEVRQIHGYGNELVNGQRQEAPAETHKAFLDLWLSWLRAGSPRKADGAPRIETKKEAGAA